MEENSAISKKVISLLSQMMGVEDDDITPEDSFVDDLNMEPSQVSDFLQILQENNFEISGVEIENMETVGDLIEDISSTDLM